ncbi:restriction endonuclease subunit S [Paenibacillus sp. FSL H8-0457]|uniref:restriction endonuclease subunit S n=1 Tax=unclassified Paenibacillus TaxID=185978 RepID=UPI0003E20B8B|nr:restriction endonuclease subunit S [Paenibacillus sp. FSL H8-457]ETT65647.1 restriction endonuclease S subunit [Paenibacillus sp. FSL H8-457]
MSGDKVNVPKIRFPEFTDAWGQHKLGELYTERKERGHDSLPILSVSIHNGVSNEELDSDTLGKNVRRSEDKSLYKHVYFGDLVFNMMRAWQGAIGVVKSEGMVSPAYITAIPSSQLYPSFMDYCLRRDEAINQIDNLSYGVTDFRKRLYWDSFINVLCRIPSVPEQEMITAFFTNLDHLITLHQRKLNNVKNMKAGLLKKMFPKEGEDFPEVRFPGFTDAWEQRKLVDNVEEVLDYRGKSPTKFGMEWGNEGYLVLSALNIKDGYIDKSVEAKYGDQELFEKWMGERRLDKGDVLFTTEAPLGNVAQVPDDEGYILNQRAVAFKTNSRKTNNDFFAQLLRSPLVQNSLNSNASGGTAKGIGMKEFAKLTAYVPTHVEEQTIIGTFFKHLDRLITLHQRKLEHLQQQKKSLLQQMFV